VQAKNIAPQYGKYVPFHSATSFLFISMTTPDSFGENEFFIPRLIVQFYSNLTGKLNLSKSATTCLPKYMRESPCVP